ncbi:branched-chain amino acid transport system II carrier protein [Priestia megaterium]|nr:branched-chain amino acid transport system II carrier protein [Priestia megaterium]
MKQLSVKEIIVIGFMLFALFFGAGNLIFPPFLGQEAGTSFWPAMVGFILTGVGLPIIGVIAIASVDNGVQALSSRVHPIFGVVFTTVLYLMIGPFMGIPRGANVAYEMGVAPFLGSQASEIALVIFSVLFFGLVYWLSLNPTKLVDRIGSLLTPFLLVTIGLLGLASFVKLDSAFGYVHEKYQEAPFFTGFMEGYLTMDTIASLAFGIVVITAIKEKGISSKKAIVTITAKAGAIAGAALCSVYVLIGVLGAKMGAAKTFENGGELLTTAAEQFYGSVGIVLLGLTVAVACFTTCVGLITACSQYFQTLLPTVTYQKIVTIVTVISFILANVGLNQIIAFSVPVLTMIYPLTIMLVILSFFHKRYQGLNVIYITTLTLTGIVSIYDGFVHLGLPSIFSWLPFYEQGLGWVMPALLGVVIGIIVTRIKITMIYLS